MVALTWNPECWGCRDRQVLCSSVAGYLRASTLSQKKKSRQNSGEIPNAVLWIPHVCRHIYVSTCMYTHVFLHAHTHLHTLARAHTHTERG